MMSQMDSVTNVDLDKHYVDIVNQAKKWGHPAIALTDHNGIQSFPAAYEMVKEYNKKLNEGETPFKVLYGTELLMIDDKVDVVVRPSNEPLVGSTYVVFDFETTGFNAGGGDSIIEIGAVKILGGDIIEKYDELINPGRPLPSKIVEVTSITDDMLVDKDNEENAIKRFIAWIGNLPMVAHNAKFDVSFLEMAYKKYNLGIFTNTVVDTLELSRTLDTGFNRHSLSALVKRYNIPFDEESHHRGDYDAEATALVFYKMSCKLKDRNFETINDLTKLVSKDEIYKFGNGYHINVLCKNKTGLKNLFQIISLANTKYIYKVPRILRSEIDNYREGLLIGSGCYESEVFTQARSKSDEELANIVEFYDYVEVQPPECYEQLVGEEFSNQAELLEHIRKIIKVTEETGKIIVATGDVHNMRPEDKIYREIIVNQKVPGGGRHPLSKYGKVPNQYFRTTREMLEAFEFLPEDKAYEIVVTNTNKIANMCEIIEVIIETGGVPFSPKIDKSVETVTELVYNKAADWYGNPLPYNIEERIAKELYGDGILGHLAEEQRRPIGFLLAHHAEEAVAYDPAG
jgi:DNA polymerase-3 subunit alpha (Gram-positive type)